MPLKIVLIGKAPAAHTALMPNTHVPVLVMITIFPHRIEPLIAVLAPMPKLIQMPQHMLLDVLLVHERAKAKIANRPISVLDHIVEIELTILAERHIAHVTVVNVTLSLLDMPKEHEFIDKQLFATQAFVMRYIHLFVRADKRVIRRREIRYDVTPFRRNSPR